MATVQPLVTPEDHTLAASCANRVYRRHQAIVENCHLDRADLVSLAFVGLLEAKQRFDPKRGIKWKTFATYRMEGAIIDELRNASTIRLPQSAWDRVRELENACVDLEQAGESPSPSRLAELLGWEEGKVHRVANSLLAKCSFDSTDAREEENPSPMIVLEETGTHPEGLSLMAEMARLTQECLDALPSDEDRMILLGRLLEGLTLRELAETFRMSLENIRLRQKKAQGWMRECLENHGWPVDGWQDWMERRSSP